MDQLQGVTKFTIKRSMWLNGSASNGMSLLLDPCTGKMCCLGFFGRACGVLGENLSNVAYPQDEGTHIDDAWPLWLFETLPPPYMMANRQLAIINDDSTLSQGAREQTIAKIFASYGVEVEFVD